MSTRRALSVILQTSPFDCGPVSLAIVLKYFGKRTSVERLRRETELGSTGTNAACLLHAARLYGLRGVAIRLTPNEVLDLPPATILHWGTRHFVVMESACRDSVELIDPSRGRRTIGLVELGRRFGGVALVFTSSRRSAPERRAPK
ncbi:MAG TPA: cysteine peptidase family C39 domain-containing protein [Vicinamibacterales bacterium]|nr:cysteine peptidase family C39 domain-containing protein [Vicinamibacterales bacterium]